MPENLQEALNRANPNNLPDALRTLEIGDILANSLRTLRGAVVTADRIALPEDRKALIVLAAYANAGTLSTQLTGVAPGATPATGQVGIFGNGDIRFAAADAVTLADVIYLADDADVEEFLLTAAASNAVLPVGPFGQKRGWLLVSAEVVSGAIVGTKTVNVRGATPGAGTANLADDGFTLNFNAADVVAGVVRVRVLVQRGRSLSTKLALTDGY